MEFTNLVTLDHDPTVRPDVVHDLEILPLPFGDNQFDEIHAYEVLEHTGKQGDWRFFFSQFAELHRILKPGGYFFGSVPCWNSIWAFGDPSHKRVISKASLTFLAQEAYAQVGQTSMTDFRDVWWLDFPMIWQEEEGDNFRFILEARK